MQLVALTWIASENIRQYYRRAVRLFTVNSCQGKVNVCERTLAPHAVELVPFPILCGILTLSPDMHHRPRRRHEIRLADVVAFFFLLDDSADEVFQLFVCGSSLHLRVQVVVPDREQAGANFAVAGDADAAAMSAKGMRDRRDDADFADAVVEAVAARGFRTRVRDFD